MAERICSIEGCGLPYRSRGWCRKHYERWCVTGDPLGMKPAGRPRAPEEFCEIADCGKPAHARGKCVAHYRRWRLGEPLETPVRVRQLGRLCEVEGCQRPYRAGGLCSMHWQRHNRDGDVGEAAPLLAPRGSGYIRPSGYKVMRSGGKDALEHRLVMEQILGRPLEPGENVHHRNGQRADNRPENLELWYVPQPYGQRIDDLVAWMVKFHRGRVVEQLDREDSP